MFVMWNYYEVDYKLNIILFYMNSIGIKQIDSQDHNITIEFRDGTILKGWNCNRWYAWLTEGVINFSNGEKLSWSESRPNNEIFVKLKRIVKKWEKQNKKKQKIEDEDFTKYLPKGYKKRIERLKKLEQLEKKGLI